MNIRPLYDKIVVRRNKSESVSKGGIFIPDDAQPKSLNGRVLATGKGRILPNGEVRPLDIAVGDTVFFRNHTGQEIKIDGEMLLILREDDVEAVGRE